MAIIKCLNEHFYDDRKHEFCPYCKRMKEGNTNFGGLQTAEELRKAYDTDYVENNHSDKTIGIYSNHIKEFVTGWLVCVEGAEKGKDYHLHHGFNRVARDVQSDVCILGDPKISHHTHCSIVYDSRKNSFSLVPEEGGLTWCKGQLVETPLLLVTGDRFVIGNTELEFIAFCRNDVKWVE